MRNHTAVTVFIVLGLTDDPQLQILLFIFLFITYILSITGNLTIIILTLVDPHLKTPMYFFLQNFSFLEILFTTTCIPRFLYNMSTGDRVITYKACFIQLFLTDLFGVTEFFLLAAMSYDRYVAICKPLHYMPIMSNKLCKTMVICCWMAALMTILPPLSLDFHLEFCDSNIIDHFVCDISPLLKISCSDTWLIEQMVIACSVLIFIITLLSFSTCSSHMIVLSISYGSCIFIYIKPSAKEEVNINKGVSLLISSISPMLNPFIYTLRNKQVKQAFDDSLKKIAFLLRK
uniref:Olfactory receptor n=1 Tax=Capra hircus TaxID=9925 RepID=A0A452DQB5_CAPHI